jgi:hypothetical protein
VIRALEASGFRVLSTADARHKHFGGQVELQPGGRDDEEQGEEQNGGQSEEGGEGPSR